MSLDIAQRVRQRLASTTLIGQNLDLSFQGKARAKYIYTQAKSIAHKIELIEHWVEKNELTEEKFAAAFEFRDADNAIVALGICKSFQSIFDTFSRNLKGSFHHGGGPTDPMLQRFPELYGWTIPRNEIRHQRNKCAHGCGIDPLYIEDRVESGDSGNKIPFIATEFWDNVIVRWLPRMQDELYDLLFLLRRDLPTMNELPPEKPLLPLVAPQKFKPCLPLRVYVPGLEVLIWLLWAILSFYSALFAPSYAAHLCVSFMRRVFAWPLVIVLMLFDTILRTLDSGNEYLDAGYQRINAVYGWIEEEYNDLKWQKEVAEQPLEENELNWKDDAAFLDENGGRVERATDNEFNFTWSDKPADQEQDVGIQDSVEEHFTTAHTAPDSNVIEDTSTDNTVTDSIYPHHTAANHCASSMLSHNISVTWR